LAALLWACAEGAGPAALPTARIDYVDGALEPIVAPGQTVVIEGFGFGTQSGSVALRTAGGAEVPAPVDPAGWTDFAVRATVPPGAAAGPLTLTTAAGRRLTTTVHVLPAVPFSPTALAWRAHAVFPRAPVGVALAAAEFPTTAGWSVTLFAAGGAEPLGGDSLLDADSGVYVARAAAGGSLGAFVSQGEPLPAPRAFAAAALATRYNSRTASPAFYIIGGIDTAGRAQSTVLAADVTTDGVASRFIAIDPLPAPVAGAIAAIRGGRVYVMGGTDAAGRPRRSVYVGRIAPDGRIDGWFVQPDLPSPRAYGGGVILSRRAVAFGGLADSTGPGGELDSAVTRLATTDTAGVSPTSGFFMGAWAPGAVVLPAGRSQFATLDLGTVVLVVGGLYSGAASGTAETLAATVAGDALGPFTGPVGTNTIAGLGGGFLVGPAGASWRDADGTRHGVILGGFDLVTRLRRAGVWGF
jgi:hypothetical protein